MTLAPTRIVLFDSPPSMLAAAATALATAKAAACAAATGWFITRAVQPAVDAATSGGGWLAWRQWDAEALVERLVAGGWYNPADARLAAILAVLAALGAGMSRAAQRRIVWRLEAEVPVGLAPPPTLKQAMDDAVAREEDPWVTAATLRNDVAGGVTAEATRSHTLLITRPTAWGGMGRVERVPRSHVACAAPSTAMQSFRLSRGSGRWEENYLLPTPGWRTEHGAYLKTLLRGDYFRPDDAPPTPDIDLIAIDGFGPYRPAQFADPLHPDIARVAAVVQRLALPPPPTPRAPHLPRAAGDGVGSAASGADASGRGPTAALERDDAVAAPQDGSQPPTPDSVASQPEYGTALVMAVTGHIAPPLPHNAPPVPPVPLAGTPYRVDKGTVWADFTVPERPTLLEARRISAQAAIQGRTAGTLAPRARTAEYVALGAGSSERTETRPALPAPTAVADGAGGSESSAAEPRKPRV